MNKLWILIYVFLLFGCASQQVITDCMVSPENKFEQNTRRHIQKNCGYQIEIHF